MRLRTIFTPLIALALCLSAAARDPEIEVVVTPHVVTVGEPITVRVTITHETDCHVGDVSLGDLSELLQQVGTPEISPSEDQSDGSVLETWQTKLVAFDTGDIELPDVSAPWITSDGFSGEARASLGTLTVETVLPLGAIPSDPMSLHGPFMMDVEGPNWIWPTVIALAVLVAAWFLWRRLRRPKDVEVPDHPRRVRPAHELALEDLDAIEQSSLIEEGKLRIFFFSLTDIVRVYFEREFHIGAPEMTSHELLEALTAASFPADLCGQISKWIGACDLVKFASQQPRPDHCKNAIAMARKIVVDAHQHHLDQTQKQEEARAA